jgi:superoxide reductase
MTEKNQVWKCEVCGNIIEVLHEGADALVCCGQPMKLQEEKSEDPEKGEKHVPVIEEVGEDKIKIKVGAVEHPMEEEHHIEWIEVIAEGRVLRKTLEPGEKPEKEFTIRAKPFIVREYCNLHGLWSAEYK